MRKEGIFFILQSSIFIALTGFAAESGTDSFVRRQAYAELQRINGALEVLESGNESLARRLAALEGGKGEIGALKSDIDSLRAEIASLRREMQNMRGEIVRELTGKVVEINKATQASVDAKISGLKASSHASASKASGGAQTSYDGPAKEYVVQPGDSLTLISQAFGTKVSIIKEMNNLKSDSIRVGQKLYVPKK